MTRASCPSASLRWPANDGERITIPLTMFKNGVRVLADTSIKGGEGVECVAGIGEMCGSTSSGEHNTFPLLHGERGIINTCDTDVVRINEIEFSNNSSITFTRPAKLTMQAGKIKDQYFLHFFIYIFIFTSHYSCSREARLLSTVIVRSAI